MHDTNTRVFRNLSDIYDKDFFAKIVTGIQSLPIFANELHHRYMSGS